jgi:hypothetical protein
MANLVLFAVASSVTVSPAFVGWAFRRGWLAVPRFVLVWCSKQRRHYLLQATVLRVVLFLNPHDGFANALLGHIRLRQGHRLMALWNYASAYATIVDQKQRAAAAYMAARANALMKRPAEAGRWLVVALDLDRHLLENARLNPDFDAVSREPEFRRRIGPGFDYGIDTDAP